MDANVVVKWFLNEVLREQALAVQASGAQLLAPDLIVVEAASVFLKKTRSSEMSPSEVGPALAILQANVTMIEASKLVRPAIDLALQHNRSLYDALYLALAVDQGAQLVTADERLINGVIGHLKDDIIPLADFGV